LTCEISVIAFNIKVGGTVFYHLIECIFFSAIRVKATPHFPCNVFVTKRNNLLREEHSYFYWVRFSSILRLQITAGNACSLSEVFVNVRSVTIECIFFSAIRVKATPHFPCNVFEILFEMCH
jgi:hypothetical protein